MLNLHCHHPRADPAAGFLCLQGSGAAGRPAAEPLEEELSDEEVENNPELHPLKEALQRAQLRLEEATGIRWDRHLRAHQFHGPGRRDTHSRPSSSGA